jgi:hypothetical protein
MHLKKILLLVILIYTSGLSAISQTNGLLEKLDSISKTQSISRHFARLYYYTTVEAVNFFAGSEDETRGFMEKLEENFGDYFIRAAQAFENKQTIPVNWRYYYADTNRSAIQYLLLGANAHINGDIWKALTSGFSLQEIRAAKKEYFHFNKGLKKIYAAVYQAAIADSKKIRRLHRFSFGFDKLYGKLMLKKWRKRQMQLALCYFTDKKKFEKNKMILDRIMNHLDKLISKNLR